MTNTSIILSASKKRQLNRILNCIKSNSELLIVFQTENGQITKQSLYGLEAVAVLTITDTEAAIMHFLDNTYPYDVRFAESTIMEIITLANPRDFKYRLLSSQNYLFNQTQYAPGGSSLQDWLSEILRSFDNLALSIL